MTPVFVTGGSGLIGGALVARLVKIGVRELSMAPGRIPAVKEYLRER